ncbi:MAG: hypothetical protein JSW61_09730 [Candidatus Thorarchaeota archaeon]|nr:MAG: hypothetical protein JSW61_09730 [Candidatus Thorarchaeota archaeon]
MTSRVQFLLQALAIASIITIADLAVAFLYFLLSSGVNVYVVASNLLFLEFGVMLMVGACLITREPLDEEKKYDEEGAPVRSMLMAQSAKKVLASSVFVVLFSFLFTFLSSIV